MPLPSDENDKLVHCRAKAKKSCGFGWREKGQEIIRVISDLVNRDWNVRICHIGRMANKTVDSLVKLSRVMHMSTLREVDSSCRLFLQPPHKTLTAFHDDLTRLSIVNQPTYV
ncbi:hypothetical protein V6N12_058921 [Hibiscus sabdariffa]|uniref:RNase H type-1 domain-containing protein n=1 Tax=Hibiscus sabdariffa TaxID=183260 RepID=A0ABR2ETJ1_9ROSI